MTQNLMLRGALLSAAFSLLLACGPAAKKCTTNADCAAGETCNTMSGTCQTGTGGGIGGGTGGASGGGTGGASGGGTGGASGGGAGGGTGGGSGGGVAGGETCEMATMVSANTTGTTVGSVNDYDPTSSTCPSYGGAGLEVVYAVTVPAGQRLTATVTPEFVEPDAGLQFDPAVYLIEAPAANCSAVSADGGSGIVCVDGADDATTLEAAETVEYFNAGTTPKELFLVIDTAWEMDDPGNGAAGAGNFALELVTSAPPADDTCNGTPTTLGTTTPLTGQTLTGYGNDYSGFSATGCDFTSSNDRVYTVTVPNGQQLLLTATPEGTSDLDLSLNLVDGAGACGTACVAAIDDGFDADPESLTYTNNSGADQALLIIVDSWSGGTGTFSLAAQVRAPPADDVCGTGAAALTAGTPIAGQSTSGYQNDYENGTGTVGCASSGTLQGDRVYSLSIPNNTRGVITVTPGMNFDPSISLVEGAASVCAAMPRVCAAGSNSASTGDPETLTLYNTSGGARNFFAIVDSSSAAGGDYSISFTTNTPGTDDTCTTATTAAAGTQNHNLTGFSSDYSSGTGCLEASGPDRVYTVALTDLQKYSFTATPTGMDGGLDPVINFIVGPATNCEASPRTCAGGVDRTLRNQAETGAFTNTTGGAITLFVVMADYETDSTNRDYTLVSSVAAAPMGETCGNPATLAAGTLAGQSTVGASADVRFASASTTCINATGVADQVYSVTVGNGQMLTVVATPTDTSMMGPNLAMNLIDGAGASACTNVMTCAASINMGGRGAVETLTHTNSSGAQKTYLLQVAGSPPGAFGLNVTIQ